MAAVSEEFYNESLRINRTIYIPGSVGESTGTDFNQFCEDLPERGEGGVIYDQLPALLPFADMDEWPDPSFVAEVLQHTPGFLIRASTPAKRPFGTGGAFSYSWGYTNTCWLYAPTEAEILPVAKAWAETVNN